MSAWNDRTPGTWMLYQFVNPGRNGMTEDIGEFPTFRAATEAARRIAKISKLKGHFNASFCRSHKCEGAVVDGFTSPITLEGPTDYTPDIELRLRDDRVVWLSDLEDTLHDLEHAHDTLHDGPPAPHQLHVEVHDGKLHLQCDDCPQWHPIEFDRPTVADLESFQAGHSAGH